MDKNLTEKVKEFFNKDFFKAVLIHYVISLCVATVFFMIMANSHKNEQDILKKAIISKDILTKERDGQYRKMVNFYNTGKELNNKLKSKNIELYNIIKSNNEKILSLTNIVISLKPNISNKPITLKPLNNVKDSLEYSAYYPDSVGFFVRHYGTISTKTNQLYSNWEFGNLDLDLTVSQDKNGLWTTRVGGPSFLIVKKLTVESLKPEEYTKSTSIKNFSPILGGGILYNLNSKIYDFKIGGGFEIKNKIIILGELNTNKNIGLGIYKRF